MRVTPGLAAPGEPVAGLLLPVDGPTRVIPVAAETAPGSWRWPLRWVDALGRHVVVCCGERRNVAELPVNEVSTELSAGRSRAGRGRRGWTLNFCADGCSPVCGACHDQVRTCVRRRRRCIAASRRADSSFAAIRPVDGEFLARVSAYPATADIGVLEDLGQWAG